MFELHRDATNSGWHAIHDSFGYKPPKYTWWDRIMDRLVPVINWMLRPTKYKLMHRSRIMSPKMAFMMFGYGDPNKEVAIP